MTTRSMRPRRRIPSTAAANESDEVLFLLDPPHTRPPSSRSSAAGEDVTNRSSIVVNPQDIIPSSVEIRANDNDVLDSMKYYGGILCQFAFIGVCVCTIAILFENHILGRLNDTIQTYHQVMTSTKTMEQLSAMTEQNNYAAGLTKCQRMYRSLKGEISMLRTHIKGISERNRKEEEFFNEKIDSGINKALNLYDADKDGQIDYALESNGGTITSLPGTTPYPATFDLIGLITVNRASNSHSMIRPGVMPGQCFAFRGSRGRIRLALAQPIYIHSVTLEHAHRENLLDSTSTPKEIKLIGLEDPDAVVGDPLAHFVYKRDGPSLQNFRVERAKAYRFLELNVLSNYGNVNLTCVYRFRVHGSVK